ncbi:MAG: carbohydrate porin [Planctomycetota bacterium]
MADAFAALEEQGVDLRAAYTGEVFANLRGGLRTDDAARGLGLFDLTLRLDTLRLGLWTGGLLRAHLQAVSGRGISAREVGAYQQVSNIEAGRELLQLSALTYRQAWLDERLWLLAGKQDANDLFAASSQALLFLHSSAGYAPNIPMASYPAQEWGLVAGAAWPDVLELRAGVFQGQPEGGRSLGRSFARLRGPLAIAQLGLDYELLGQGGQLQLGGWYDASPFRALDEPPGTQRRGHWGGYAVLDQWLWRPAKPKSEEGLGVFAHYAWAPPTRSEVEHYLGGGLRWTGPWPGRPHDALGLACYQVRFGRHAGRARAAETAVELVGKLQLTGFLALFLDAQLVHHPDGSRRPAAVVLGARFVLQL